MRVIVVDMWRTPIRYFCVLPVVSYMESEDACAVSLAWLRWMISIVFPVPPPEGLVDEA